MSELTIWTYDWVPEGPRGFVRDLRLRWACEEAGLSYAVGTVPFDGRETNHLAQQPFGQVPFLTDDGLEMFESCAGLLHLARKSDILMPRDPAPEAETVQWTIAAINSIEIVTLPWWFLKITGGGDDNLTGWVGKRLDQMERVLAGRHWLAADRFTVADLLMADVLRIPHVRTFGRPAKPMSRGSPIAPPSTRPASTRSRISGRPTRDADDGRVKQRPLPIRRLRPISPA